DAQDRPVRLNDDDALLGGRVLAVRTGRIGALVLGVGVAALASVTARVPEAVAVIQADRPAARIAWAVQPVGAALDIPGARPCRVDAHDHEAWRRENQRGCHETDPSSSVSPAVTERVG